MAKDIILIVDDSDDARKGLALYLSAKGFEVEDAPDGEKAIELLQKKKYNLVLSDLKMKDIDGIGVLKKVKEFQPKTEVIIMTAYASVDTAVGAMKLGAYDYVSKPLNLEEIEILIDRCLEKQKLAEEVAGLKELVNLYEVSKGMVSVMDLDQLLNLIIKLAADTLNAEGGSIMILNESSGVLLAKAATGKREEIVLGKQLKVGERIAGYAALTEDTVKIDGSIKDDPRFKHLEKFDGINSGISVPLTWQTKLLGVINLNRSSMKSGFTQKETDLLKIFAAQAAIAIENSYLFSDLNKEKEKLDTLFRDMGNAALITDENMSILMINQIAGNFFGLGEKECIGKTVAECTSVLEPSIKWKDLAATEENIINFSLIRESEYPLYLSVSASKIRDEEKRLTNYIMIMQNVTEEKKEDTIKKNFLRLMSHKLRTPLTSIIGFTSTLRNEDTESRLTAEEVESLKIIETKGDYLSSLVDKLLRYTMLEAGPMALSLEEIPVYQLINDSLEIIDKVVKDDQVIIDVCSELDNLPALKVDRTQMQEVLENIIENAVKFNSSEKKEVHIDGFRLDEHFIQLEIRDNGPGIPPEERNTIFEKFYQLEKYFTGQVEGFGLGLALAKRILESHGCQIWAEINKGGGSCFKLTLPLSEPDKK